jgi:hypothetical protein
MPRVKKNGFLAYSKWDIIPVVCGVLHLAFIVGVFLMFDRLPLWALGVLGAVYAISISWDINGISHNFPHSISYLNGYFEHYAGNPDKPIAWGVSTYHKLYNWTWFNNRHHAEHHHRPRQHWTKMRDLHLSIQEEQEKEGTHVIRPPYALGFFDPDLPPLGKPVPVFKKGGAAEVA